MFLKFGLLSIVAFLGAALACKPNFEGNAQTVYRSPGRHGINEWTPNISNGGHVKITSRWFLDALAQGEFFVPFTGTSQGTYLFKPAADSSRQYALEGSSNGNLVFKPINWSYPNKQEFSIDCDSCAEPGSGGDQIYQFTCTIKHSATGKCVTGVNDGDTIQLQGCTGAKNQIYSFVSGPSP